MNSSFLTVGLIIAIALGVLFIFGTSFFNFESDSGTGLSLVDGDGRFLGDEVTQTDSLRFVNPATDDAGYTKNIVISTANTLLGDTNAQTSCSGLEYLSGSGSCETIPSFTDTDTNFQTAGYGDLNMDLNYLQIDNNVSLLFNDAGYITGYIDTNYETAGYDLDLFATTTDKAKLQNNILINAFRISVNGSLGVSQMHDGIIDEYEDELGINGSSSTNEIYDSTSDYYHNSAGGTLGSGLVAQWKMNDDAGNTIITDSQGSYDGALSSSNSQDVTTTGVINGAIDLTSDVINVSGLAGNFVSGNNHSYAFWVNSGNCSGQCDVILDGALNFNGIEIYVDSDDTIGVYDGGSYFNSSGTVGGGWQHVVVTIDSSDTAKIYIDGSLDTTDSTSLATSNSTGDFSISSGVIPLDGIVDDVRLYNRVINSTEVGQLYNSGNGDESSGGGVSNMTLISEDFEAESNPDTGKIVIFEQDVDTVTLNTDLKAYISRDDGTTFSQVTLTDEGDFDQYKRILTGEVDISGQPSDKTMLYKITTHNTKELQIHGVGLLWD